MLQILSWNIRQGGGTRISKIKKAIQDIDPHILALSEWRNNSAGIELRINLLRLGYIHQHTSGASSNENSVLLASKFPFESSNFKHSDSNFPHNVIAGKFDAFDVYSVYLPHKKKHRLLEFLHDEIRKTGRHSIIVGDYNTGHNGIDQKGNSFWYTDELRKLETSGMIDAYRYLHGSKKEYSWYSHQGNGYRYDHSYVSEELSPIIKECDYLASYRKEGISDHSPMILTLGN